MRNKIEKIISGKNLSQQEITEYIVEVCDLFKKPITKPQEIQGIIMGIQMGQFDLMYSVKIVCSKLEIPLRTLTDKHGRTVKMWIQEESLKIENDSN